jgi:hypothetical protein
LFVLARRIVGFKAVTRGTASESLSIGGRIIRAGEVANPQAFANLGNYRRERGVPGSQMMERIDDSLD